MGVKGGEGGVGERLVTGMGWTGGEMGVKAEGGGGCRREVGDWDGMDWRGDGGKGGGGGGVGGR